ncbi:MAG: MBL fold metallo-hydrolase [Bacteroidota bacterium]|nr:MBL fold metallo-hydrolase [Bacteroidota bacterium]
MQKTVYLKCLAILFVCVFICNKTFSQERLYREYVFWGNPQLYQQKQAFEAFSLVDQVLRENPPSLKENLTRQLALCTMDLLVHDATNDTCTALYNYMNLRIQNVIKALDKKPVKQGMEIYKLYNDGFIVRTKSSTLAFDIIQGGKQDKPYISDENIRALAGKCDMLFISHSHGDHASLPVAKLFMQLGKPVYVPKGLWAGEGSLIREILPQDKPFKMDIAIKDNKTLKLEVLPGHQDDIQNNIYVVTFPEKLSVAHTGDQYNDKDMSWIPSIKEKTSVDVLLINVWTMYLKEVLAGFNAKVVITGHENEIVHSVDHREAYWMSRKKMNKIGCNNAVIMTWGESYLFNR